MIKIKDIPINDRPIERLINNGVHVLSNEELLSILIKTGTKEESVKQLANRVLIEAGDIKSLKEITYEKLIKIKGIGPTKACIILSSIELSKRMNKTIENINKIKINNSNIVFDYFKDLIGEEKQEYFYCLYLDINKRIIKNKMLFKGTLNHSLVHPREIFKEAYLVGAVSIICIHNHPSGLVNPSRQDIELTNNLKQVGKVLGIGIDDHIIVGQNNYYSFFENNEM